MLPSRACRPAAALGTPSLAWLPVAALFAVAGCGGSGSGNASLPPDPPDPRASLLPGADPHVAFFAGEYWVFRTSTVAETANTLHAYVGGAPSSEPGDWSVIGPLLTLADVAWIEDDGAPVHYLWAPAVVSREGAYYLYFSVGPQDPTPSRIGVAVADNPAGPYVDSGAPLLTGGNGFEAIDPMVFVDPATDVPYLYAGGSAGSTLRLFQLRDNLVEIEQEFQIDQPENFTEAPFMHLQNGLYYLSYSNGRWNDDSYSVHYSVAPSPHGPWTYCGVLVETGPEGKGPGHNSFLEDPDDPAVWHFIYHQWDTRFTNPPYSGDRHIVFDELDLSTRSCPG